MNIDGVFLSNDITTDNIAKISDKQSFLEEKRICELYEMAKDAAAYALDMQKEGYGIYEILSIISDGFSTAKTSLHNLSLDENRYRLSFHLNTVKAEDKIIFADLFMDALKACGFSLTEKDFLSEKISNQTFTYVKNALADEAYDVFSQDFDNPKVKYSKTFNEAARAVSLGDAQYALLPLEERGGARLSSVAELLFNEDLKINSVTPVFGYEGNADMKYAMVSKHFTIPKFETDDDRYLEIRLRQDLSVSLSELFLAADFLRVSVYRVNTILFETEDGKIPYYSVVFKDEGEAFSSLLVYLTLFAGAYTPVGIYKNLE